MEPTAATTSDAPQTAEQRAGALPMGATAIVCDGDAIAARLLARSLASHGFAVTTCGSVSACDAAMASGTTELLILELLLPGTDGLAYTRRLRSRGVQVPIVVVSALHAAQRAREAGADAFLLKPISLPALDATLGALHPREGRVA